MLAGYMRVSTDSDRQVLDLQRDALLAAGVDERHLFEDRTSGSRSDRAGLAKALAFLRPGDCLVRIGFLNHLFYGRSYSAGPGELSILVCG
jgi:DNA invertase Pin-like site-specific DNA recombinase